MLHIFFCQFYYNSTLAFYFPVFLTGSDKVPITGMKYVKVSNMYLNVILRVILSENQDT